MKKFKELYAASKLAHAEEWRQYRECSAANGGPGRITAAQLTALALAEATAAEAKANALEMAEANAFARGDRSMQPRIEAYRESAVAARAAAESGEFSARYGRY